MKSGVPLADASQEELYRSLIDYFKVKSLRVMWSSEPTEIKLRIGSWRKSFGSPPGTVEVRVAKNGETFSIAWRFRFRGFLALVLIALVDLSFVASYFTYLGLHPSLLERPSDVEGAFFWAVVFLGLACLIVIGALRRIRFTKNTLLKEYEEFAKVLRFA